MSEEKNNPAENEATQEELVEAVGEEQVSAPEDNAQALVESLQAELAAALEAAQEAKDGALRAAADAQNVRRRSEQDVEKAHKFALDKFSIDLLPVMDSLERTVEVAEAADDSQKALIEGVQMTLGMLNDSLKKFKVIALNPVGEPFDPQMHQAMSMQESADVEPGSVMAVFQKGYTLNERLIRPAMVVVSKASASQVDEKA